MLSPDSYTYIRWAETLASLQFDYLTYFGESNEATPYLYVIPVSVIALLQTTFGDAWQKAFHSMNALLIAASILASYLSLQALSVRPAIAAFGLLDAFFCVDFFVWPHYLLSDTIYVFFISLFLFIISLPGWSQSRAFISLLLTSLLLLCRPTSPVYCAVGLAVVIAKGCSCNSYINKSRFVITGAALVVFGSAFFISVVNIAHIYPGLSHHVDVFASLAKTGVVIHDRPDTFLGQPDGNYDLFILYLHRLAMFWNPYLTAFSLPHNVLNIAYTSALFTGVFAGWHAMRHMGDRARTAFLVILILCIAVSCFHALTIIDYDWRYRYPLQLPLLVCALIGIDSLLKTGIPSKPTRADIS